MDYTISLFYVTEYCIWTLKCFFFGFIWILCGEIIVSYITHLHDPRLRSILSLSAQSYDIREFLIFDRLVLRESTPEIDLIVPDITSRAYFIEEYDIGLHSTIW